MRRDYCPSRQEQKKLKPKKPQARMSFKGRSRISQKELQARRTSAKKKTKNHRFLVWLISLILLLLGIVVALYLLRQQWFQRHQLEQPYFLLITKQHQARFLVKLSPGEEQVSIVDLRQHEAEPNLVWEASQSAISSHELTDQRLFFSLTLGQFIDQVLEQESDFDVQDQLAWQNFLINDYSNQLKPVALNFLRRHDLDWTWPDKLAHSQSKNFACPVVVVNTSQHQGLATQMGKMLETASFSVIRRDSGNQALANSYLALDPNMEACLALQSRFAQLLPEKEIKQDQAITRKYRAGAVIFIGEDLANLKLFFTDFLHSDF